MQEKIKKIIIFYLLFIPYLVFAHPHTFIDVYTKIKSQNTKIDKITFTWYFDEMTSSLLIMEFDQNMDGKLDDSEIKYIYENYFLGLGDFNFYTDIQINNKTILTKPQNFTAFLKDNIQVAYQFDIILNKEKKDIKIEIYDEERFSALILKNKFIHSDTNYKLSDIDNDLYFGYRLEFK
jgi:ABC-type uncharacterized transport system substrate-binding protein